MNTTISTFSEAVHSAAEQIVSEARKTLRSPIEALEDFLFSLASYIPESWRTRTRALLAMHEHDLERMKATVESEMTSYDDLSRYSVLSSIYYLVLMLKNMQLQIA